MVVVDGAPHHQAASVIAGLVLVGVGEPAAVRGRAAQQVDAQTFGVQQRRDGACRHPAGQRRFSGHQGCENRQAEPCCRPLIAEGELVGPPGASQYLHHGADVGRQSQRLPRERLRAGHHQHRARHLLPQRFAPHMERARLRGRGGQVSAGQPREHRMETAEDVRRKPGRGSLHRASPFHEGDLRAELPPQPVDQRLRAGSGTGAPAGTGTQLTQQLIEYLGCRHGHPPPARPPPCPDRSARTPPRPARTGGSPRGLHERLTGLPARTASDPTGRPSPSVAARPRPRTGHGPSDRSTWHRSRPGQHLGLLSSEDLGHCPAVAPHTPYNPSGSPEVISEPTGIS